MRRVALVRRRRPLTRHPLRRRSEKREAEYAGPDGRRAFVAAFIEANPHCMVAWEGCTVYTQDVHEWWSRGTGGAIVPGEKADRQGQRFVAVCRHCHGELDLQPDRAKKEGWVRGVGAESSFENCPT